MNLYEIKYIELQTELITEKCSHPKCQTKCKKLKLIMIHKVKSSIVRTLIPFDVLNEFIKVDDEIKEPLSIVNNILVVKGMTEGVKSNCEEFNLCRPSIMLIEFKKIE